MSRLKGASVPRKPFFQNGSFALFRLFGIQVWLHWTWFLVALYQVQSPGGYARIEYRVFEYLTLFGIVLAHEFGHSLACRSVGGEAHKITLNPLGGVAYVDPPFRPGAELWSIAAGPLVNVALAPFTIGAWWWSRQADGLLPDQRLFFEHILWINGAVFVFNMLPIYPLDGGKILRALLWYAVGPAKSLMVAAVIGIVGVLGVLALAIQLEEIILGVMAILGLGACWQGIRYARSLRQIANLPQHRGAVCPECSNTAPAAKIWRCKCDVMRDVFADDGVCPSCGFVVDRVACVLCRRVSPITAWTGRLRGFVRDA